MELENLIKLAWQLIAKVIHVCFIAPFFMEIFSLDIGTCQESSNDAGNDEKPGPSLEQPGKHPRGIQCFTAHVHRYSGTNAERCTRTGDNIGSQAQAKGQLLF